MVDKQARAGKGNAIDPDEEFRLSAKPSNRLFCDITGARYGRLMVVGYAGKRGAQSAWACVCDCGGRVYALGCNLKKGQTESCGCLHKERTSIAKKTHGLSKQSEYSTYYTMLARCDHQVDNNNHFIRGIRVCERWTSGEGGASGFECFLADMGRKPSPSHTIERIDNDGNYDPGNCRWATRREQAANTPRNRFISYQGERLVLAEVARRSGVRRTTIARRLDSGWSIDEALIQTAGG